MPHGRNEETEMTDIKTSTAKISLVAKIAGYATMLLKLLPDRVVQDIVSFLLNMRMNSRVKEYTTVLHAMVLCIRIEK